MTAAAYRESEVEPMRCDVCHEEVGLLSHTAGRWAWSQGRHRFPWRYADDRSMCQRCTGYNGYAMLAQAERRVVTLERRLDRALWWRRKLRAIAAWFGRPR